MMDDDGVGVGKGRGEKGVAGVVGWAEKYEACNIFRKGRISFWPRNLVGASLRSVSGGMSDQ